MRPISWFAVIVLAPLASTACGDDHGTVDAHTGAADAAHDGPPGDARTMFDTLFETGLCVDPGCATIASDVLAFRPRSELWSDGATKRRWIKLPTGTQIDTADMDYWQFPVGTKLWKEFTRGSVRVETRLIQKVGPLPDDWVMTPFIWNTTQDVATATTAGMYDANGTPHDVPSRAECRQCHDRVDGGVLGFSAIQLDAVAASSELGLDDLVAMNLLTAPPTGTLPYFALPGTTDEQAALSYLHANCGHCHNPTSDVFITNTTIDLRMRVGLLATAAETPAYTSTINIPASPPVNGATLRVHGMNLADSVLYQRFITTVVSQHMPRLGVELTAPCPCPDPSGQLIIETWINGLPP